MFARKSMKHIGVGRFIPLCNLTEIGCPHGLRQIQMSGRFARIAANSELRVFVLSSGISARNRLEQRSGGPKKEVRMLTCDVL